MFNILISFLKILEFLVNLAYLLSILMSEDRVAVVSVCSLVICIIKFLFAEIAGGLINATRR